MPIAIPEDDEEQREPIALCLEGVQHTSRGFGTRADCIVALKQERIDLILLDWMLPNGNGADVLHWARQNPGWDMPNVVVTAHEDEENLIASAKQGMLWITRCECV